MRRDSVRRLPNLQSHIPKLLLVTFPSLRTSVNVFPYESML